MTRRLRAHFVRFALQKPTLDGTGLSKKPSSNTLHPWTPAQHVFPDPLASIRIGIAGKLQTLFQPNLRDCVHNFSCRCNAFDSLLFRRTLALWFRRGAGGHGTCKNAMQSSLVSSSAFVRCFVPPDETSLTVRGPFEEPLQSRSIRYGRPAQQARGPVEHDVG